MGNLLETNIEYRNKHLLRGKGKYNQYKEELMPAIGEAYEIRDLLVNDLKGGKDLYEYTISNSQIQKTYFSNVEEIEKYSNNDITIRGRWNGEYSNYIDYIQTHYGPVYKRQLPLERKGVVGSIDSWVKLPLSWSNFLSNSIGTILEKNGTLGFIHYSNPYESYSGEIQTNPNNSKTDTKLGLISNKIYGLMMKKGAQHGDNIDSLNKYITPMMYYAVGNNSANFQELTKKLRVDDSTGFIPPIYLGTNVGVTEYNESTVATNGSRKYLDKQLLLYSTFNTPLEPYIEFIQNDKGGLGQISNINEFLHGESLSEFYGGNRSIGIYNEGDYSDKTSDEVFESNDTLFNTFNAIKLNKKNDLLSKTEQLFKEHKINTLIGRFHTSSDSIKDNGKQNFFDTAKSKYGNSHGRNLLTKDAEEYMAGTVNGYRNPYCRTWTYHHQYSKVKNLIRPFTDEDKEVSIETIQTHLNNKYRSRIGGNAELNGEKYLARNTVLGENGFVNITPKIGEDDSYSIKRCMFSIENLAWRDVHKIEKNLSKEQTGPNGGRIMWFPPYDLKFDEAINVDWNSNSFIGRGEKVYTYTNTDRTGTLSFALLIDHPSIVNSFNDMAESFEGYSDNDALRFFAGCDLPNDTAKRTRTINNSKYEAQKVNTDAIGNDEENGEHCKLYIFFPNNYSGYYNETGDDDWEEYLGRGFNIYIDDEKEKENGYEMQIDGNGISKYDVSAIKDVDYIQPCNVCNIEEECREELVSGRTNMELRKYFYRVDYDLRQPGLIIDTKKGINNYQDSTSFGLNGSLDVIKKQEAFSDATCTFKDLYELLYEDGEEFSEGGEVLRQILNKEVKIGKIIVTGVATNQNSINSEILAIRRRSSVVRLFREFLGNDIEIETKLEVKYVENSKNINDIKSKLGRYVGIDIIYNSPEIDDEETDDIEDELDEASKYITIEDNREYTRYETEGEYFKRIELTEPLIYRSIIDKFKHFNPAFHSMTPEGFNARLTFLQQCTRQGQTIESKPEDNSYIRAAGNLAFGRMPVCVLRIGDFIYQKIIINNINITYGGDGDIQWDLNPEGSGVQPMYARVSMGIVLLGGGSLEGPINRLQNAVTFNYYANTGVYDDRSDRGHIVKNGINKDESNLAEDGDGKTYTNNEMESKTLKDDTYTMSYDHIYTPYRE